MMGNAPEMTGARQTMSRRDFIEASRQSKRLQNFWGFAFMGIVFLCSLSFIPLAKRFETSTNVMRDLALTLAVAAVWMTAAVMVIRKSTRHQIVCSGCKKPLMGFANLVVVASRHCGHCGVRVLDDPD